MNIEPNWTVYLSALLTPVVAIYGSFIAYLQWRLSQNKLKLDLFDRRFKVYEAARDFLASIITSGKANEDNLFKFLIATREAKWLLNPEVAEYLDKQMYSNAINLQTLAYELKNATQGEVRYNNVQAQADIKKWFLAQYEVLDVKFTPFLRLNH